MAEKIQVSKKLVEDENMQGIVDMLNGLAYACYWEGEFQEGWRNKVIVDLVAGSVMVGLDPVDVIKAFIDNDLIDPRTDDESTWERVDKVLRYTRRYCWDWLISPEDYVDRAKDPNAQEGCPVEFVLV